MIKFGKSKTTDTPEEKEITFAKWWSEIPNIATIGTLELIINHKYYQLHITKELDPEIGFEYITYRWYTEDENSEEDERGKRFVQCFTPKELIDGSR